MPAIPLPLSPEEITTDWVRAALAERHPGVQVTDATVESVQWGTATKVFVHASYSRDPGPDGPPERICIKGGFDPALRTMVASGYHTEARFFADIAPGIPTTLPRCWFAASDPEHDQAIVILDDLRERATFGRPTEPLSPDLVAAGLELQATWHAQTWDGAGLGSFDWLPVGAPVLRGVADMMLSEESWKHHVSQPKADLVPQAMLDRERFLRGLRRLWESDDRSVLALSHGDAHIGNTYVEGHQLRFLDWQTACLAPWSDDVAYFLVGSLTIADRRDHERDLLAHYLKALAANGAPALDFEDAWTEYRTRHLHGLLWLLVPEEMQPAEYSAVMAERYGAAAFEQDNLGLLNV
jgi:hypothetical protein